MIALQMMSWLVLSTSTQVVIVDDGPVEATPGQLLISDDRYQVVVGGLLDAQIGTRADSRFSIPHARLRVHASVDVNMPLAMQIEIDASPYAQPDDNLNGPWPLRDAVLELGVGNRRVMDLGVVRIGQQRVTTSAHSMRPVEEWHFSRRPIIESLLVPGRDLGVVYHMDYGSYGWPLDVHIGSFAGAGPGRIRVSSGPLLALRVESQLERPDWIVRHIRLGGAWLMQQQSTLPLGMVLDAEASMGPLQLRITGFTAETEEPSWLDLGALRTELGCELLADFLFVWLRAEADNQNRTDSRRLSASVVAVYLDRAFQILLDLSVPSDRRWSPSGAEVNMTLRLWW